MRLLHILHFFFFFFNDTAPTEIYTLSLHDALPICPMGMGRWVAAAVVGTVAMAGCGGSSHKTASTASAAAGRSEEHTSELQSPYDLVCRLLLEKKKKKTKGNSVTRKHDREE